MNPDRNWPTQWPVQAVASRSASQHRETAAERQDALLDEALKETFPASDPVSVVRVT